MNYGLAVYAQSLREEGKNECNYNRWSEMLWLISWKSNK